ncbi:xanthosine transporter XapB [Yersinia aldovae]|nr:xanthosine transporter XapB [Yersinia aldovae]
MLKKRSWVNLLGLDAFVLFKQKKMAILFLFAMLPGASLQISHTSSSPFLHDFVKNPFYQDSLVVQYPSILLSMAQIAEVFFILTIPFFMSRFGIKRVMMISMIVWTLRFALFVYGDSSASGIILLLLSMVIYGCAFDFFNISDAIYVEKKVSPNIRGSAQGLFMTMVNGVGVYAGAIASGHIVDYFTLYSVKDWNSIWLSFSAYTLILLMIFVFIFQYKHDSTELENRQLSH